jgi:hypothetical protein
MYVHVYMHTKFQMPSSNGSLVTDVKLNAKYRFHATTMLVYIP